MKRLLFHAVALLLPLLLLALLELGLRLGGYGDELALFVPEPEGVSDAPHLIVNPVVARRYFPGDGYMPRPRYERFLRHKPVNGYRIFVLGGSSAAAWPHPANVAFSRMLQRRLAAEMPHRHVEVVNLAISAINSFALLDFIDEVMEQQPDAVLIYAGHNEFYGALGAASTRSAAVDGFWVRGYLALLRLKSFQLLRDALVALRPPAGEEQATLMARMVGQGGIAIDDPLFRRAQENFRHNLEAIVGRLRTAGVEVVVSELVSNLRDQRPFQSLTGPDGRSADELFDEARRLEAAGSFEAARAFYLEAKERDGIRFRAPERFNAIIREVARNHGAALVPMVEYFERASPNGLIGASLMLEHLHPNAEGQRLMARAFHETMARAGLIEAERTVGEGFWRAWPVTALDEALARIRILHLTDHPPFPPRGPGEPTLATFTPADEAERLALAIFREEIGFAEGHHRMARHYLEAGHPAEALREWMAALEAAPHDLKRYFDPAPWLLHQRHYRLLVPLLRRSRTVKESAYANKWLGIVELEAGRAARAMPYLLRARALAPEDGRLLHAIGFAALRLGLPELAFEALAGLEALGEGAEQLHGHLAEAVSEAGIGR